MRALISRQSRNLFPVIVRKMALLSSIFLDIVPLKKADVESIYLALVKCIKDKNLQVDYIAEMGVDGAATVTSCNQLACKLPIA